MNTVAFSTFVLLRFGSDPLVSLTEAISAGDTDSIAAIVGAWLGALHGEEALPCALIDRIHDGPFGPSHLRALARCLADLREGKAASAPRVTATAALLRNLCCIQSSSAMGFEGSFPSARLAPRAPKKPVIGG